MAPQSFALLLKKIETFRTGEMLSFPIILPATVWWVLTLIYPDQILLLLSAE